MLSDLIVMLGVLVAGVLGVLGFGEYRRRQGEREAEDDFEEADRQEADAIRRRVERERDDRMRDYSDRGYRD